jgi:multidrug efflux pump subunit AcrA (membrane-fusion protein)
MKKFVIIFVILLIVAGLIFIPQLAKRNAAQSFDGPGRPGRPDRTGAAGNPATVFSVRTEDAETRTLQAYIEVNANIISGQQVAVMPDANGRLVSMRIGLGDTVQRGTLIAEVDPSRPGTDYSLSPVYAPVSGIVVSSPLTVGSTISTATPLFTLAINNSIEIEALIPEREVGQLRTGLTAEVRLEAFPGETFRAAVTLISPIIDPVSRTRKITLLFSRNDNRIVPGMFARVKLNTRTYENVVSVPQSALVDHRGRTIVYVLENGHQDNSLTVQAREVSIGVNVDNEVEIRDGLKPGEAVVVQGQQFLTDGAAVRVIGGR